MTAKKKIKECSMFDVMQNNSDLDLPVANWVIWWGIFYCGIAKDYLIYAVPYEGISDKRGQPSVGVPIYKNTQKENSNLFFFFDVH